MHLIIFYVYTQQIILTNGFKIESHTHYYSFFSFLHVSKSTYFIYFYYLIGILQG
jgi:hypothetical protein